MRASAVLLLPMLFLVSCVGPGLIYPPDGQFASRPSTGSVSYSSGVSWGSSYRAPYGYSRYGGNYYRRCSRCSYSPCRCGHYGGYHRDHHDHDHERETEYRIVSGDLKGKERPKNFHTEDWFKERGYNLRNVKVERDDGKVFDRRPSSQRSSSSSSSSRASSSSSSSSSKKSSSSSSTGRSRDGSPVTVKKSSSSSSGGRTRYDPR